LIFTMLGRPWSALSSLGDERSTRACVPFDSASATRSPYTASGKVSPGVRVANDEDLAVERCGAGHREEVVDLMARRRAAQRLRYELSRSTPPVDDVAAARRRRPDEPLLTREAGEERLHDRAGLAADKSAQDWVRTHLTGHARHPHALPAGVEVDVVRSVLMPLDCDGQDRIGAEDRNSLHRPTVLGSPGFRS
jgi:hypothetical protein